jgi:hypothetical protein
MSDLKSLKFTAIPKDNGRNQVFQRRIKLIEQLEHQRKLIDDPAIAGPWCAAPNRTASACPSKRR